MLQVKYMVVLCLLAALTALTFFSAQAQQPAALTNENIRIFMEDSAQSYQKPYDQFLSMTKTMTHDSYKSRMLMTFHNGNEAPVQVPVDMDKQMLLQTARQGYDSMKGASLQYDIQDIHIHPNGKSATVKSTMVIKNQNFQITEGSMQTTLADSTVNCVDELVFSADKGIQFIKSDYTSDVTIKQEQEL